MVDTDSLKIVARVAGVPDPDGIAYAPKADRVFVSDERSKADAVIDAKTNHLVSSIALGGEAGNTVYDSASGQIVVAVADPAELALIDPVAAKVTGRIALPGVKEPHGVALDTAQRLAFVAGEGNATLAVVDLESGKVLETHAVGEDPDVLAFDPGPGLLYVAAESGSVSVFKQSGKRLASLGRLALPHAHTVSVDPGTHLVYLPLEDIGGHGAEDHGTRPQVIFCARGLKRRATARRRRRKRARPRCPSARSRSRRRRPPRVAAEAAQQVGADRVEEVVRAEVERVHEREPAAAAVDLGHRDRAVERHDRARVVPSSWS